MTEQTPLTNDEKIAQVKLGMKHGLIQHHNALFGYVSKMPINDKSKEFCLMNMVQAVRWAEDAIEILQFEIEKPVPTSDEQSAAEEVNQTNEGV